MGKLTSYNMRNPSKPDYDDYLELQVRRRSPFERIMGALWILFAGWR